MSQDLRSTHCVIVHFAVERMYVPILIGIHLFISTAIYVMSFSNMLDPGGLLICCSLGINWNLNDWLKTFDGFRFIIKFHASEPHASGCELRDCVEVRRQRPLSCLPFLSFTT